jgi:adenine-specific DNA-methyltransferase
LKTGLLGIIISNTWLQSVKLRSIRKYLISQYSWVKFLHLPEKVFKAVVDTHVLIFNKKEYVLGDEFEIEIWRENKSHFSHKLKQSDLAQNGDPINIVMPLEGQKLYQSIAARSSILMTVCDVYNGIKPFEKGKGTPPQTEQTMKDQPFVKEGERPGDNWSPLLRGSLLQRYELLWNDNYWVQYGPWLAAPRDPMLFDAPLKIMARQTGDSIIATLVKAGFVARNNLHIILPKQGKISLYYILGLINSRLMDFYYSVMNPEKGEALAEVKKHHIEQLPIRTINFDDAADKGRHDQMVQLVELMLELHKKLPLAQTSQEKTMLQRRIEATDKQIDALVYELYGLTAEEIAIVEGG